MSKKLRVLVVDDEPFVTSLVTRIVDKLGCEVNSVLDGHEIGKALLAFDPEIIFLDLMMPEIDGVEIINLLGETKCEAQLILMSGLDQRIISSVAEVAKSQNLNVLAAITKPLQAGQIEGLIKPVIALRTQPDASLPTADEIQVALPGPQLIYQAEVPVGESSDADIQWYRVQLGWRLDDDQVIDISEMLENSVKNRASKGLINLCFKLLALSEGIQSGSTAPSGLKIPLPLAILLDPSTPNYLEECVDQAGLSKHAVSFEVSESAITGESEALLNTLSRLKIKGFKIAVCVRKEVDRVLSILSKLPVDELVLDMSDETMQGPALNNTETEFQIASLVSYALKGNLVMTAINLTSPEQLAFAERCNFHCVSGPIVG